MIPDDKKITVLVKSYVASVYDNNREKAKVIAVELKRLKAEKYLNIPPKTYTFTQYIPFQTIEQVNAAKQLISENKNEEALTLLESSLKIYDSHIANRMIGEIYFSRRNTRKALPYFYKVYNQFKFDPRFLHNMAIVYLANNDLANARKCLNEIKTIDPGYENMAQLNSLLSSTN